MYELLDRAMPATLDDAVPADVPNVVGELSIFETSAADGESARPRAVLSAFFGAELDAAEELIGEVDLALAAEEEQLEDGGYGLPEELWGLRWRWAFPEGVPLRRRRELEAAEWDRRIGEVWPSTPLAALGGKSPADVGEGDGLAKPLAGALYVLDAVCDRGKYELDLNGLRERFGLPRIEPAPAPADAQLNGYSILHLQRTDVSALSDRHLLAVLNRALLVHPVRFLRARADRSRRPRGGCTRSSTSSGPITPSASWPATATTTPPPASGWSRAGPRRRRRRNRSRPCSAGTPGSWP